MRLSEIVMGIAVAVVSCGVPRGTALAEAGGAMQAAVEPGAGDGMEAADPALEGRLHELATAHHGRVALYATQLNTGRVARLDADAVVQTASVIKLTILFEAMEQVRAGKAHWEDKITLEPGDAVSGSGLLLFLDTPLALTLKDVLTLMIVMSDNTATNLAIDRIGLDAVNARIAWMGLKDTHLYKKIGKPATEAMPADQPKFGLGKTTPREMARVMERIGRCELAGLDEAGAGTLSEKDTAICGVAIKMLRNQFYHDMIPRYLEKLDSTETGSGTASKHGSLNAVRADVAIVEAWSPDGIDGKTLVPGLGLPPKGGGTAPATRPKGGAAASN